MLTVVCWKWRQPGYRSKFGPETVNTLRNMVSRHYAKPHEFVCITDDARGIDTNIRIVPLWNDFAHVPNPHHLNGPSCYRRLKAFSPEAAQIIGPRFVSVDLDCVITADMSPIWDVPDDFKIWGDTAKGTPYNGSMFMMTAGARAKVWSSFDPVLSPKMTRKAGMIGSDQAWLGVCLGPNEKKWNSKDGVYSYRNQIMPKAGWLPSNARIVFFHGQHNPWDEDIRMKHQWVKENYR